MANIANKRVNIYIDQSAAEAALDSLQKKADGITKKIDACRQAQIKLLDAIADAETAGKSTDKLRNQYQELEIKINAYNKQLLENKDVMRGVQDQIDKGLSPSLSQQKRLVEQLRNELSRMSKDTPGYAQKFEAFKLAKAQLDGLKDSIDGVGKAQKSWFDEVKTIATGVFIGNIVTALSEGISGYITGIISGNAKLADSLKTIQKATGLSAQEVENLNQKLGEIDTRTSRDQLREIAVGLGQINEEANKANVEAIDKIVVSLGDEFGQHSREITNALSVLRNNLQDLKTGNYAEDILHIGNALNVAGAEGLATAPVVTDIANRIAGVAQTFNVSSGQILGIASTFQELGIETERGSTAIIRMFQRIAAEPEKFAAVAGKSLEEFTELVNKDMLGAFLEVAKGAQTAGSSNVLFGQILKELDADGSGAGEVLSKLGTNYQLVGDKVKLMTDALRDGNSITQEFNLKNTGLAAELDKLSKAFNSLLASRALNDILASLVGTAASFLSVIRALPQWLKENQTGVYLLVAGIATLNASYIKAGALIIRDTALKITNAAATRATAFATNIAIAAQAAWIIMTDLLTGKIKLAIAAQRLWNVVMSVGAGPIGIILIAVGALVVGITSLYNATHKLTAAQQLQQDIQKKVVEATSDQVSKIEILKDVITDTNVSLDNRKKALEELIRINPKYLEGLTLENFNTEQGKKLVDGYIDSLKRKAEVEAKASLLQDKIKQRDSALVELRSKADFSNFTTEDFEKYVAQAAATAQKNSVFGFSLDAKLVGVNLTELNDVFQQISILRKDITDTAKKDIETIVTTGTVTSQTTTTTIATIKEQIQQLDKDVESIDAKNTKAITENRTKRKALQDQLDNLLGNNKTSQKAEKDATQAANAWDNLISKINDNLVKLTKDPFHYQLDKIFSDRIEQLKEIDKLGKEAGKSQTEINAVKFKVEVSSLASVQKLISETKLEKPKPIELPIITRVNLLDKAQLDIASDKIKKRLSDNQRDNLAKAELDVLQSSGRKKLDAQLALLKEEEFQELHNKDHTEQEKLLIEEQYRKKREEAELDFFSSQMKSIQEILGLASQALDVYSKFNEARNNKENAALKKELKANDDKKASYKRMLDAKIITEADYKAKVEALDKAADKKKEALERQQFERGKKIQIAQALVNGALGITSVLAARPGATDVLSLGLFRAINIALTIATTAAQVAAIASSRYEYGGRFRAFEKFASGGVLSLDEEDELKRRPRYRKFAKGGVLSLDEEEELKRTKKFARGGKTTGPSHAQHGLPVINPQTGEKVAELEGDEGILKKSAMYSKKVYTVTGTPSQITSTLNGMYGGTKWDSSAIVQPSYKRSTFKTLDVNKINKGFTQLKFAQGGIFNKYSTTKNTFADGGVFNNTQSATQNTVTNSTDPLLLQTLQQSQAINAQLIQTVNNLHQQLQTPIKAEVPLKKIQDAQNLQNRILRDATFK